MHTFFYYITVEKFSQGGDPVQLYLAVTPDSLDLALRHTNRIAHVGYRIEEGDQLACCRFSREVRGGMMLLSDGDGCAIGDEQALCAQVLRECAAHSFGGVVADFEQPFAADRGAFLVRLCALLRRNGRYLFVPESYGREVRGASVTICTAISGGTLRERLEEARDCFGERISLDLQRVRMEFPLPCPGGEGKPLSQESLAQLLGEEPAVFFSEDLGAKYFVRVYGGEPRFVMFDDAYTLRRKMNVAQGMGIGAAFVMYPEVEDILGDLWNRSGQK